MNFRHFNNLHKQFPLWLNRASPESKNSSLELITLRTASSWPSPSRPSAPLQRSDCGTAFPRRARWPTAAVESGAPPTAPTKQQPERWRQKDFLMTRAPLQRWNQLQSSVRPRLLLRTFWKTLKREKAISYLKGFFCPALQVLFNIKCLL